MKHIISILLSAAFLVGSAVPAYATTPSTIMRIFTGPAVSDIATTSATVALSSVMSQRVTPEEKARGYFEYTEPNRVCIAIYPTPTECLPKTTEKGLATTTLFNLKPDTRYSVVYKYDNTIRCITTPCPDNGFVSDTATFTTMAVGTTTPPSSGEKITTYLGFRSRGAEVMLLQNMLITRGFMTAPSTGYFGIKTMRAVKAFQKSVDIPPTGFVGPRTMKALNDIFALGRDPVATSTTR